MSNHWTVILDFLYLSLFIFLAIFIKQKFKIFNKFLLPTSFVAGFIGLILGPEILNLTPFNPKNLETLVYHLMSIGFIALALKERNPGKQSNSSFNTGITIVSTYLIQGIVGFGITLIFLYTIFPDIFPTFGLLLPLGFGQGPGVAFSIGDQWVSSGFSDGGQVGLAFSTIGFLWASIGGVIILNYLVRQKKMKHETLENDVIQEIIKEESDPGDIPLSTGLDKITVQICLIGIVYLTAYLTLVGLDSLLKNLGTYGETLMSMLWGFQFLFGTVYAIILRLIFDYLKKKEIIIQNYPNNYLLQRISGASFDYMIAASVAALSIVVIKTNLLPLFIITLTGGLVTFGFIYYLSKRIFKVHTLEYILALYGMLTGTLSTGLALLREVDPEFNSQVAENLVFGSAIGLFFGLPLMLILGIPVVGYVDNNPIMYVYTLLALVVYLLFLYISYKVKNRKTVKN
ncbi:MAG: S-layer homology domain-containing protein [Vulcanibacillus sp.]